MKKAYIFNCNGTFNLGNCSRVYQDVTKITGMQCNKYECVFTKSNGKLWSRSGSVKNMASNFQKYLDLCGDTSRFALLSMYDKPQGICAWELDERRFGFYAEWIKDDMFNIYVILPEALDEQQIISLWELFSNQYDTNYMVHFPWDSTKDVEICMHGRPMVRSLEPAEKYFTVEEYNIILRLNKLRRTYLELGNEFPVCIIKENVSIDKHAYKSQKNISAGAYLLTK